MPSPNLSEIVTTTLQNRSAAEKPQTKLVKAPVRHSFKSARPVRTNNPGAHRLGRKK